MAVEASANLETGRHYDKPPIREAVIDLCVESRSDLKVKDLKKANHGLEMDYPDFKDIYEHRVEAEFQHGVSASSTAKEERKGFKFTSKNGRKIWQSKNDGFTFSQLAPYDRWEALRDEARRLWTIYRNQFHPRKITRVAVRYINRIDIPGEKVELKDYFRTSPEISSDLPQGLGGFFMQLQLPQHDISAHAILNQTIVESPLPETVSIILDIDVFRIEAVPNEEDVIWDFFEELHSRKNLIFEACITDATRSLFR